jgi:hypothetical protein
MATQQLAKGLASLGRHGDSMLMHVSPSEVAGLKAVGAMTGHKLHTNPRTGMPEAFDFGDFFTSLLPTLAGFMVGGPAGAGLGLKAGTTAATIAPIAAGMATGAAVAGAKGDNVLMGTLMGGLGGYGGGSMGSAYSAATNPGITNTISGNVGESLANQADKLASNTALNTVKGGTTGIDFSQLAQGGGGAPGVTLSPSDLAKGALGETRGTLDAFTPQAAGGTSSMMDTAGRFVENLGGTGPAALKLGAPTVMAGYEAGMFNPKIDTSLEEKRKAEEMKYVDKITGKLNPYQSSPNFGTMLMATGGTVNTNSSSISSGGIQDLYGTNDQTTGTRNISQDGYGIGRLNSLAAEGSKAKAADTFYAAGGPIAFADGGIFELEAAKGGYLDGAGDGGEAESIYLDSQAPLNLNLVSKPSESSSGNRSATQVLADMDRKYLSENENPFVMGMRPQLQIETFLKSLNKPTGINSRPYYEQFMSNTPGINAAQPKSYALNVNTGKQEPQYAQGGYLDGAGDGMSDSIPATIEGKQPARLADGEFVIPADVVSHLGNGSTKAGSKRLYAMLDKVRHARTGTKKQGKEIKPEKYMLV